MDIKKQTNLILKKMSIEGKQRFYSECSYQLAKGKDREIAISDAFKKLGINPRQIDLKDGIDVIHKNGDCEK